MDTKLPPLWRYNILFLLSVHLFIILYVYFFDIKRIRNDLSTVIRFQTKAANMKVTEITNFLRHPDKMKCQITLKISSREKV